VPALIIRETTISGFYSLYLLPTPAIRSVNFGFRNIAVSGSCICSISLVNINGYFSSSDNIKIAYRLRTFLLLPIAVNKYFFSAGGSDNG